MPNPSRRRLWIRFAIPFLGLAVPLVAVQSCHHGGGAQAGHHATAVALPAPPADATPFEQAKHLHFEGVAGNKESHEKASAMLTELHAEHPDDALVTAYLGSNRLTAARDHFWPPTKGELATEGANLLDAALEAEPDDLEIRFLRGSSTVNLPKRGGRYEIAVADLKEVAEQAEEAVREHRLEPRIAAAACRHHARVLADHGRDEKSQEFQKLAETLIEGDTSTH